jgi:squalene-hopene/tetraprenyl-beta-curcumene cyclase
VASAFVFLALEDLGYGGTDEAARTLEFLLTSQRDDGSWPIVNELAVWNTILVLRALETLAYDGPERTAGMRWLVDQARFCNGTCAWQWTPGPGGIPETDDTSLAMAVLAGEAEPGITARLEGARRWLGSVQNPDGGWPTFARGSGSLPFDRSGVDLTAHVLEGLLAAGTEERSPVIRRGLSFLESRQAPEGCWESLWFGSAVSYHEKNRTHGTSQVLGLLPHLDEPPAAMGERGASWLLENRNEDGGWGSCRGASSSCEETAAAVSGLLAAGVPWSHDAVRGGIEWLLREQIEDGTWRAAPIGLYYEALKYEEAAYPVAFGLKALGDYLRHAGGTG